jgi:cyclophilin family peptidyl-prolyl cis-trans isomerase
MSPKLRSFALLPILFVFAASAASLRGQQPAAEPSENREVVPPEQTADSDLTRGDKALIALGAKGPTNAAEQAKAAFDAKFNEYKAAVRDIEKLRTQFQAADAASRQKINTQLTGQIAHAKSLVNEMLEAAVEAYRFAPNSNEEVTELLVAVARYDVIGLQVGPGQPAKNGDPEDVYYPIDGGDRYERALPVLKLLIENGAGGGPELYVWGFLAAFATNDYELASTWLQKAQQEKAMETIVAAANKSDSEDPQTGLMKAVVHQLSASAAVLEEYRELWKKESEIRATEATADDLPRVKLTTTKGEIVVELFENEAPQSVANFITLVKQEFYDGTPFHRVLPKFMAQGGDPSGEGTGGPGYSIRGEASTPNHRKHFRGTLSMAHSGHPDSGGSQFFLTFVPTAHLNGKHTAFGRVIEGMEVLADLQRRSPTHQQNPPKADRILKAELIRDRGHEYQFDKLPDR